MSIEIETTTIVLLAIPLLAAVWGLRLALQTTSRAPLRLFGSALAILGPAQIVAMLVWFGRGCFETWQPCGGAFGLVVGLLWAVLAVAVAATLAILVHGVLARRGSGTD